MRGPFGPIPTRTPTNQLEHLRSSWVPPDTCLRRAHESESRRRGQGGATRGGESASGCWQNGRSEPAVLVRPPTSELVDFPLVQGAYAACLGCTLYQFMEEGAVTRTNKRPIVSPCSL